MQRLTYWVIAAISMLAVNLVLLAWIIVPLEWDLESEWFPVSVNSKNETTYRPSISSGSSGGSSKPRRRRVSISWSRFQAA